MIHNRKINHRQVSGVVYDISLDGTVVNALGMNIISNTDGFNFQMPKKEYFRYTEDKPYISSGRGRNTQEGKAYFGVDADVAEFEDLFLCYPYTVEIDNKMGLGVDEYAEATINLSRKNYADLLGKGKVKLVGNSIKSKKMSKYIENFLNQAIRLLLDNDGKAFLELYYDYIEKIYNMKIPLKEIASVGKIKRSIEEYKEICQRPNADGSKKSRQAWYELCIKEGIEPKMGEQVYFINTGVKKGQGDVSRTSVYYIPRQNGTRQYNVLDEHGNEIVGRNGNPKTLNQHIKSLYDAYRKANKGNEVALKAFRNAFDYGRSIYPNLMEEDKLEFHCVLLPNSIVEDEEEDYFCDENIEYNRAKYIDAFNKKVTPLLVCFDRNVRSRINEKGKLVSNILIDNPKDRRTFTDEEAQLVMGQPFQESDQDTYAQLMTMEDKEIAFWMKNDRKPLYAEECGMDWEALKADYTERMEQLNSELLRGEVEEYNKIFDSFGKKEWKKLIEDGILPPELYVFAHYDKNTGEIKSNKHNVRFGFLNDFVEKYEFGESEEEDEEES